MRGIFGEAIRKVQEKTDSQKSEGFRAYLAEIQKEKEIQDSWRIHEVEKSRLHEEMIFDGYADYYRQLALEEVYYLGILPQM